MLKCLGTKYFSTKMSAMIHFINCAALLFLTFLSTANNYYVGCFPLNYGSFPEMFRGDFILSDDSNIAFDALQVTEEARGAPISKKAGRILYRKRFRLWDKGKIASFNSTFVLNIQNQTQYGGEGLAFILAKDYRVPPNSDGQWLGIVNAVTNGSDHSSIVAVEFDTRKSFLQDLDDNHVGLNINSVYSKLQVSLTALNISIADGKRTDITAMILYDGKAKLMNVYVFKGSQVGNGAIKPIMSVSLDLTRYLPSEAYVGFSASTGSETELNCVKAWYFNGDKIAPGMPLWWVWLVIPLTVVLFCGYLCWSRKGKNTGHISSMNDDDDDPTIQGIETGLGPKKIKLKDLKAATGNFDAKNELGRGGFGVVYHGIWEGNEVAVKRITNTPQGKQNLIAEVTTIGSLHHKNLVKLMGWCYESNELLLVYEYMPNNSLDKLLICAKNERLGVTEKVPCVLTWEIRHTIICGVAQALDYLHNECSKRVLHRDIKASNIMLDTDFNARLGDFGLARMFKLSERTHHSTKEIAGTPG